MTTDFKEYLVNAKNQFVTKINDLQWDTDTRVAAENIVIAIEQAIEKLTVTTPLPDDELISNIISNIVQVDVNHIGSPLYGVEEMYNAMYSLLKAQEQRHEEEMGLLKIELSHLSNH